MVLDLLLGSLFYASTLQTPQLTNLPRQYSPAQSSQSYPTSVDSILRGTKFIPVCSDDFVPKTSKGNVVLFAYNQSDISLETSAAMAKVLRRVIGYFPPQTGITFLKFDVRCNPALRVDNYQRLTEKPYNIPYQTYVAFFKNGKRVLETPNIVPSLSEDTIKKWEDAMIRNIRRFLLNSQKLPKALKSP